LSPFSSDLFMGVCDRGVRLDVRVVFLIRVKMPRVKATHVGGMIDRADIWVGGGGGRISGHIGGGSQGDAKLCHASVQEAKGSRNERNAPGAASHNVNHRGGGYLST